MEVLYQLSYRPNRAIDVTSGHSLFEVRTNRTHVRTVRERCDSNGAKRTEASHFAVGTLTPHDHARLAARRRPAPVPLRRATRQRDRVEVAGLLGRAAHVLGAEPGRTARRGLRPRPR